MTHILKFNKNLDINKPVPHCPPHIKHRVIKLDTTDDYGDVIKRQVSMAMLEGKEQDTLQLYPVMCDDYIEVKRAGFHDAICIARDMDEYIHIVQKFYHFNYKVQPSYTGLLLDRKIEENLGTILISGWTLPEGDDIFTTSDSVKYEMIPNDELKTIRLNGVLEKLKSLESILMSNTDIIFDDHSIYFTNTKIEMIVTYHTIELKIQYKDSEEINIVFDSK